MNWPKMSVKKRLGHLGHRANLAQSSMLAGMLLRVKILHLKFPCYDTNSLFHCALFGPKESGDEAVTSR